MTVSGLGWPEGRSRFSTGLGWPAEREDPQMGEGFPQVDPEPVSRETLPPPVEVSSPEPPPVEVTLPEPVPEPVPERVPEPQTGGSRPAAAEVVPDDPGPAPIVPHDEDNTPLARAVLRQLQARARFGAPLPRPADTRVMVVANQKGGVGKTTTTVNLAAALAQHGLRVLVVDLDPQGNASTALSVEHRRGKVVSSYEVLVDGADLAEAIQPHADLPGLDVVPATIDLAGAEIELVNVMSRESRLRKALAADPRVHGTAEDRYDYVLIDCPPSLGLLTLNALVAGEEVLIPIQAEYYALEGLGQLLETIDLVRANLNQRLAVSTILITMFDARTRLAAGVAAEVREHFADQVLDTTIPRSVRVSEAPSYGQSVMTYDPGSPGALSYLEAAREMAMRGSSQ
jgi:chromosome partitioning protein